MSNDQQKSSEPSFSSPVPKAVVARLSLYLRELEHLNIKGQATTSSSLLGQTLGFTDAQVRKDLAYFGQFGYPGIGYRIEELIPAIRSILGTNQAWNVAMIGAGNLGRALLGYRGFQERGFHIQYVFDIDTEKIGNMVEGREIYHLDCLSNFVETSRIKVAVIAVPTTAAQQVADRLVEAGVEGIMNFAPITLSIPENVALVSVDLAIELEQLSFAVVSKNREEAK